MDLRKNCFFVLTLSVIEFLGNNYLAGEETEKCESKINSCSCKTAGGKIDLSPLDQAAVNSQPKWAGVTDDTGTTYSYNPCTAYTQGTGACSNVASCQTQLGVDYAIGSQDNAQFLSDPTKGTVINYKSSDGVRLSVVKLVCDSTQEGTFTAEGEEYGSSPATYDFTLTSKYACTVASGGGLSVGSVLLIVVVCCLVVYLAAGIAYMKVRKNASGVELIPNVDFWKALPGLAKDGSVFSWNKVTSVCNKGGSQDRSSYEKF